MSSNSKRTISFTVDTEEEKTMYNDIAIMQGLVNVSSLARFALKQYCNRYGLEKKLRVQQNDTETN